MMPYKIYLSQKNYPTRFNAVSTMNDIAKNVEIPIRSSSWALKVPRTRLGWGLWNIPTRRNNTKYWPTPARLSLLHRDVDSYPKIPLGIIKIISTSNDIQCSGFRTFFLSKIHLRNSSRFLSSLTPSAQGYPSLRKTTRVEIRFSY